MRIEEYLDAVCGEIRWKAARAQVREEIRAHIEQRADEYAASGDSRELAESKAVEQMGEAAKTGRELDRLHRPKYDWALIGSVAALLILGIIQAVTVQNSDGYQYPLGWIGGLVTAIAGCVLFSLVNFRSLLGKIRRPAAMNLACVAAIALVTIVNLIFPGSLGRFYIQFIPMFLLFFGAVISMVAWVSRIQTKREWRLFMIAAVGSSVALYMTGTYDLEYMLCAWLLVWITRAAKRRSILPAIVGVGLIIVFRFCITDLLTYFTYYANPANAGQLVWAPIFKAEDLNLFGHGFSLPDFQGTTQDFILSNSITGFVWQFGIAAGIALSGLFGVALWRGNRMRLGVRDYAGRMLALCFCIIFFTHTISNVIWGTGLIPNTGTDYLPVVTLQFPMSLFQGSLIGILISLFRTKDNYARERTVETLPG